VLGCRDDAAETAESGSDTSTGDGDGDGDGDGEPGDGDGDGEPGDGDGDGDGDENAHSLRFFGYGVAAPGADRLKIPIDDPADDEPGPPADIGAQDFTIELWLRGEQADNSAAAVDCGSNIAWIYGNILLDRDRYNQDRKFGLSIAGGLPVFGVSGEGTGDLTLCGDVSVLDGAWHHLAVARRRSDGYLWMFIDGMLAAEGDGPDGDVSYPDDGVPTDNCGGPCVESDPFIVIAAEKHDAGAQYPSFAGFVDELRLSSGLRYQADFAVPTEPFEPDAETVALYHFDEGSGTTVTDQSGAVGGPSDGYLVVGGDPSGPQWVAESPF
jgi:hypothetical protein